MGRTTIAAENKSRTLSTFISNFKLKRNLFRLWILVIDIYHSVVNGNKVRMSLKQLKKNIKETKPAVDTHKTILFPLDYSFKAISEFSGELIVGR